MKWCEEWSFFSTGTHSTFIHSYMSPAFEITWNLCIGEKNPLPSFRFKKIVCLCLQLSVNIQVLRSAIIISVSAVVLLSYGFLSFAGLFIIQHPISFVKKVQMSLLRTFNVVAKNTSTPEITDLWVCFFGSPRKSLGSGSLTIKTMVLQHIYTFSEFRKLELRNLDKRNGYHFITMIHY